MAALYTVNGVGMTAADAAPHLAAALANACAERDRLAAALADRDARLRDLTSRLGFGDGATEPQADNDTIVRFVDERIMEASEWVESQRWRDECHDAGHPDDEDCHVHDPALRLADRDAQVTRVRALPMYGYGDGSLYVDADALRRALGDAGDAPPTEPRATALHAAADERDDAYDHDELHAAGEAVGLGLSGPYITRWVQRLEQRWLPTSTTSVPKSAEPTGDEPPTEPPLDTMEDWDGAVLRRTLADAPTCLPGCRLDGEHEPDGGRMAVATQWVDHEPGCPVADAERSR